MAALDGIEKMVTRVYMIDFATMDFTATPEPDVVQLFALSGAVAEFESDDTAEDAFDSFTTSLKVLQSASDPSSFMEETEMNEQIGDESNMFISPASDEGLGGDIIIVTSRQGNLIVVGTAIASAGDPRDNAITFTSLILDADAGDDGESFIADGTSSGGLWAKFPATDHEVVTGLTGIQDIDGFATDTPE